MSERARPDPINLAPAVQLQGTLLNPEPGRHYVYASQEDGPGNNYQFYEMLGYRVERCTKDGVKIVQGQKVKEGQPLRFWDQVLMSCEEERKAEIDEFGPHGNTGRSLNRRIQQKINGTGLQEGVGRRIARVVNETHPLMVEG